MTVSEYLILLEKEYGSHPWEPPSYDPLSQLVLGILSQNTSDRNSRPAFQSLKARFPRWEEVAQARPDDIASAIHHGGLARIKAQRLKALMQEIKGERGALDLSFLSQLPLTQAKAWLRSLPGVGPKTASVVLLFSLGKPALPVDTHIYRVARRLGMINSHVSVERAHELLEKLLSPEEVLPFHILLLEHGRKTCRARRPLCDRCVLAERCAYSQKERE